MNPERLRVSSYFFLSLIVFNRDYDFQTFVFLGGCSQIWEIVLRRWKFDIRVKNFILKTKTVVVLKIMFLQIAASVQIDFHLMDSFAHAGQCQNVNCQRQCCSHLMQVATHARSCAVDKRENHLSCYLCRQVLALCAIHLENCQVRIT